MIQVTFYQEADELVGFEGSGHAGYDEYGRDIVCAAVSVILQTTLGGIDEVVGVHPKVKRDDDKGYLQVLLPIQLEEAAKHDACLLIRSAEHGLRSISEQYPDFVRVIIKNRRKS